MFVCTLDSSNLKAESVSFIEYIFAESGIVFGTGNISVNCFQTKTYILMEGMFISIYSAPNTVSGSK